MTTDISINNHDEYYDYYDYDISNGYKLEMNRITFLYCFLFSLQTRIFLSFYLI